MASDFKNLNILGRCKKRENKKGQSVLFRLAQKDKPVKFFWYPKKCVRIEKVSIGYKDDFEVEVFELENGVKVNAEKIVGDDLQKLLADYNAICE